MQKNKAAHPLLTHSIFFYLIFLNMKLLTFFSALWFGLAAFFLPTPPPDATLNGKITDEKGEALIGVAIQVFQKDSVIASGMTNIKGEYQLQLNAGTYDILVKYTGFRSLKTLQVVVQKGQNNRFDAKLVATVLEEVVVTGMRVGRSEDRKSVV